MRKQELVWSLVKLQPVVVKEGSVVVSRPDAVCDVQRVVRVDENHVAVGTESDEVNVGDLVVVDDVQYAVVAKVSVSGVKEVEAGDVGDTAETMCLV